MRFAFHSLLAVPLLLVLAASAVWLLYMPMQMDMASHYHPIACINFPLSDRFNTLVESCRGHYTLNVYGWFFWPRASAYQGYFPSIWYRPLWALWNDHHSLFLQNALYLLLGITALAWYARIDWRIAFIAFGGCSFVQYMILYDYALLGMVPFTMFAVPALVVYAMGAASTARGVAAGLLAGLLLFAIFETKPVFVYIFACMALLVAVRWQEERWPLPRIKRLLPGILLAAVLAALLLSATDIFQRSYWHALLSFRKYNADPSPYLPRLWHIFDAYWVRFPNAAAPTYSEWSHKAMLHWRDTEHFFITLPFWLCGLWFFVLGRRASRALTITATALLAAGVIHALQLANVYNAYLANHMAPGIFYAAAAVAVMAHAAWCANPRATALVLCVLALSQVACAVYMVTRPVDMRSSRDIPKVIDYLKDSGINAHYLTLHYDWGTYYLDAVFGPRQQVVMYTPRRLDESGWAYIQYKAKLLGRSIAIVRRADAARQQDSIEQYFPNIRRVYPPEGKASEWQVWITE